MRNVSVNPITQGSTDSKYYNFDFSLNGTPDSASCSLIDMSTNQAGGNLIGSPVINGKVVTTPMVIGLVAAKKYRLICSASISGNEISGYVDIVGEL